jgi:hypothetical protein
MVASGQVMKTTVVSRHSVRTGNEDDDRVRTQRHDSAPVRRRGVRMHHDSALMRRDGVS